MRQRAGLNQRWMKKSAFGGWAALLIIVLLLGGGCSSSAAAGKQGEGTETPSVPVEVTKVIRGAVSANYTGTTTLEAEDEALVSAKISGVVKRILVEEGDGVVAGQVMAKLEDEQFRYELSQAQAQLDKLANEFKRNQELVQEKIISAEVFERIKSEYETQQASYNLAKLRLDYTDIKAPISGIVSERLIKVGNLVAVNQATFRVTDFDPLLAVLNIPEKELSKLRAGFPARVSADAIPGADFTAKILRISPIVSAGSGTFKVTVGVTDSQRKLKPGMFVRVEIVYDVHRNVLLVPKDAILTEDIESSVFVVKHMPRLTSAKADKSAGKDKPAAKYLAAVKQKITTGYINSTHVEVLSGIAEGDQVITTGLGGLKDGAEVKIVGK